MARWVDDRTRAKGAGMTAVERQQRKRDRQKAGLVRVEVWVPANKFEQISKAIDRIMNEEQASAPAPGVE